MPSNKKHDSGWSHEMNVVNEDIFRTFQRELSFSEKDMTFERLASAIREFDRKYDFRKLSG
jgi:hypothetical protein